MKTVKKIAALLLCVALVLTCFAACHEKGAVVATYKDGDKVYTVNSGIYLAMLINADSEARTKVTTALDEADKDTTDINFSKQTVKADDGKEYKFHEYIKMRAKELTAAYILTEKLYNKYQLKMSEENSSSLANYVAYQWAYSGAMYIFGENGVSYESFEQYMRVNMFERSDIFDYLYGEDGEKAPAKADIVKELKDNFVVANKLEITTNGEDGKTLSEDELKKIADKLQAYADRINKGEDTFDDIKKEYDEENKKEEDKNTTSSAASSNISSNTSSEHDHEDEEEDEEEAKPLDANATVIGGSDTSVSSSIFEDVKKCELNEATVLKSTDGYYRLVIKKDIEADPYYYTTYRDETVRLMRSEEFNDFIAKEAKKLEIEYDSYELNYLKPKKISYDAYDEWYATAMSGMMG